MSKRLGKQLISLNLGSFSAEMWERRSGRNSRSFWVSTGAVEHVALLGSFFVDWEGQKSNISLYSGQIMGKAFFLGGGEESVKGR